jgi:hypothetical protein
MTVQQLLDTDSTMAYLVLDRFLIVSMMIVAACGWMVAFGILLFWTTRAPTPVADTRPRIPLASRTVEYQTVLFTNLGPLGWKPEEITVKVPLRYETGGVREGEGTLLQTAGGMTWVDATPTPLRIKPALPVNDPDVLDTVIDNRVRPVTFPIPRPWWADRK